MPSVNYNGQSFAIDGRRHWLLGATIEYSRIEPSAWQRTIEQARDAGFNTILTSCPWALHEPRPNRFTFDGHADVRRFVSLCGGAGMRVILRPGPYVGSAFDGGGLPAWLAEIPGIALREHNEPFLERVITYLRKLVSQIDDLQATRSGAAVSAAAGGGAAGGGGGPIILVQSEHAWLCSNPKQAETYLRELSRVLRESGVSVPLINANDLWQESPGTIDTWRGYEDMLVHLRQLRSFEPSAPLVVSDFEIARPMTWGGEDAGVDSPFEVMRRLGECLAAGGQPVVNPFAGGTNFGFLGGRLSGGPDRFLTTSAAGGGMINEDGSRSERYSPLRRLLMFANHFGHVFAELDPLDHPITLDVAGGPEEAGSARGRSAKVNEPCATVIPLRGSQGRIVFIFAGGGTRNVTLVLDDGIRMPIDLGDQELGWLVFDADLAGTGRLDYANLFPYAIIDRSLLVLQGAEGAEAFVSINGAPLHAQVPGAGSGGVNDKPLVLPHKGLHVVICNQRQIDAAHHDVKSGVFFVGASGLDPQGRAIPLPDYDTVWMITRDGAIEAVAAEQLAGSAAPRGKRKAAAARRPRPRVISPSHWEASPADAYARGESPRYATTGGPCSLNACGAPTGYGWYRIELTSTSARKQLCHLPGAGDRILLYVDGQPIGPGAIGTGPGAKPPPFDLRLPKGDHRIVALVDNMGRFADGNELIERKGLFDHLCEVKPMKAVKPKLVKASPVDPFALRAYIAMRTAGQRSDARQAAWTFAHTRKSPILVDVQGAKASGTFVLNDAPIAYFPGETGSCNMRLLLSRDHHESFKRGKNVLRFAPDVRQNGAVDDIAKHTMLYECVGAISEGGSWAFAKWEPPPPTMYEAVAPAAVKKLRGTPCWWTAMVLVPEGEAAPLSYCLEMKGLSKGQAYINGHNLGRYFTATAAGKPIGPQTRLHIPAAWVNREGENRIVIFDEHGFDPFKCRIICGTAE